MATLIQKLNANEVAAWRVLGGRGLARALAAIDDEVSNPDYGKKSCGICFENYVRRHHMFWRHVRSGLVESGKRE